MGTISLTLDCLCICLSVRLQISKLFSALGEDNWQTFGMWLSWIVSNQVCVSFSLTYFWLNLSPLDELLQGDFKHQGHIPSLLSLRSLSLQQLQTFSSNDMYIYIIGISLWCSNLVMYLGLLTEMSLMKKFSASIL
jgi:hypothetical protein